MTKTVRCTRCRGRLKLPAPVDRFVAFIRRHEHGDRLGAVLRDYPDRNETLIEWPEVHP